MQGRLGHGETRGKTAFESLAFRFANAVAAAGGIPRLHSFDYMFGWTEADRLPTGPQTWRDLAALAQTMKDTAGVPDSPIPAAYTYLGQFIDHDITFDKDGDKLASLANPDHLPRTSLSDLRNFRTPTLDLDSVYDGPRDEADPNRMKVGHVTLLNGATPPIARPPGKSDLNDLPRAPRSADPNLDRAAQIGDPRNDENIIVAQLHTAFLKAHNALVDRGMTFDEARTAMILRYQSLVLDDYLGRICDGPVHRDVLANGPAHWVIAAPKDLYMPAEFAYGAFRFGHSMVRTRYDYNLNFPAIGLDELFSFTALSGQIGGTVAPNGFDTVPDNWIIQWERIADLGAGQAVQHAKAIDTRLTNFLFELRDTFGQIESEPAELAPFLATRNLVRGYAAGLPTGQALATKFGLPALSGQALIDALPTPQIKAAAAPFADRSPLWFYVLVEAGDPNGPNGAHLGPVGSTVLMETFYNLAKHAKISLLDPANDTSFRPFALADLLNLAATQDAPAPALAATD